MADNPIENKLKAAYGSIFELTDGLPPGGRDSVVSLSPSPAAPSYAIPSRPPEERVISVTVYVLGINGDYDEPDIFVTQVTCTEQEYYEEGEHLAMAEERAREAGFTDPLFSFDEREERVVERLGQLFGLGRKGIPHP
jgi:hypothetical protein